MRVLVVDDSVLMRTMLREVLESLGHRVAAEAASGAEALTALASSPDLMILDISLPDMDGLRLLETVRVKSPRLPVLIVTGNDQAAVRRRALALKAVAVVRKPFDSEELAAALKKVPGPQAPPAP